MTTPHSVTPIYRTGYVEPVAHLLRSYTAEANVPFLLPYVRPGLRVLDFGCGLGSISMGLAKAAAPGEMHGVGENPPNVEEARAHARAAGQDNAVFHVANLMELSFEDGSFDVANCHNILMFIPDTCAALAEVMRVPKPGGIIGCREMILDASFIHPNSGVLQTIWEVFANLGALDDGHPRMGKDLKNDILDAGFENIWVGASFDTYSTPEQVAFMHFLITGWFLSSEVMEIGSKYGVSTPRIWERIRAAADRWKDAPEATLAIGWGEAVANKP